MSLDRSVRKAIAGVVLLVVAATEVTRLSASDAATLRPAAKEDKKGGAPAGGAAANSIQTKPESLLVMIGHFANTSAPCTTATAQRVLYSDPNHLDVRDYYLTASHGGISQLNTTVMDDVLVPNVRCYENDWADFLDDQARARGVEPLSFTRNMYVLPNSGCGGGSGAGNADIGGRRSFVLVCSLATMGHELGHSFGMDHANALGVPYGDNFDIMTEGVNDANTREVNAPHRLQLNWIASERVFDVPSSGTYTLGALETDGLSTRQILRIRRSTLNGDYIYVSYREPIGLYDAGLSGGQTYVHRWDGGPTDLRQVLSDGNTFEETGVARVQQIAHGSGQAAVKIDLGPQSPPPPPPGPAPACQVTAATLCLQNGRFRVSAAWNTGTSNGPATGVPFSNDTGLFWFFSAENTELAVKVLDASNNNFWVYYGGLTNLDYTITVTDTTSGLTKSYHNPAGSVCGGRDVSFGTPGGIVPSGAPPQVTAGLIATTVPPTALTCTPDAATLCLQTGGDTIKAAVTWKTPDGTTGAGLGGLLPHSSQSGDFTFFSAGNMELLAKVLDGRTINQRYWIYTGALSDVEYSITFTDIVSRRWVTVYNTQGNYCGSANIDSLF